MIKHSSDCSSDTESQGGGLGIINTRIERHIWPNTITYERNQVQARPDQTVWYVWHSDYIRWCAREGILLVVVAVDGIYLHLYIVPCVLLWGGVVTLRNIPIMARLPVQKTARKQTC